jgi:hypothetical protein
MKKLMPFIKITAIAILLPCLTSCSSAEEDLIDKNQAIIEAERAITSGNAMDVAEELLKEVDSELETLPLEES